MTLIDEFRMLADDLYSVEGHNKYASALSKAADEIERLQGVIAGLRAEDVNLNTLLTVTN